MARRYAQDEINLPSSVTVTDLDWVAFTWELRYADRTIQLVLFPGALVDRTRYHSSGQFHNELILEPSPGEGTLLDYATEVTEEALDDGYFMTHPPMLVDFTKNDVDTAMKDLPSEFFNEHPVETLGDAVEHSDENIFGTIVAYATEVYVKLNSEAS